MLGWSHYVTLLTITNIDERRFYEIEACINSWGARELERQVAALRYERLLNDRTWAFLARVGFGEINLKFPKPKTPLDQNNLALQPTTHESAGIEDFDRATVQRVIDNFVELDDVLSGY